MKTYANGEERTQIAYVSVMSKILQKFINANLLTKEEKTEFKHAFTRNEKALNMIMERLGKKESDKIGRLIRDHDVAMVSKLKNTITPRTILITDDRLRDVLEVMINDHCPGCTAENFLDCHIYKLNDDLEVCSQYHEPNGVCPYAYMADLEKQERPGYGSIFKPN